MQDSHRPTLTDKFDEMLRRKDLRRTDFARVVNVSPSHISRLFPRDGQPKRGVSVEVMRRIIDGSDGALRFEDFPSVILRA